MNVNPAFSLVGGGGFADLDSANGAPRLARGRVGVAPPITATKEPSMARYIHKLLKPTITVKNPGLQPHIMEGGKTRMLPDGDRVEVEFKPQALTQAERIQAYEYFIKREGKAAFGALPYSEDGSSDQLKTPYRGEQPEWRMSVLDTADPQQVKPEHRALVEADLEASHEFMREYIKIEDARLAKPWPSYDEITGAGADKRIAALVKNGGYDPDYVAAYEAENQNRAAVLAAVAAAKTELVEQAQTAGALSGTL